MTTTIHTRITPLLVRIAAILIVFLIGHDALMAMDAHTDAPAAHHASALDISEHCVDPEAIGHAQTPLPVAITPAFLDFAAQPLQPLLQQQLLDGQRQMVLDPTMLRIAIQVFLN